MAHLPPKIVMVATDLSHASEAALETAAFYGERHQSKVIVTHVFDPTPYVGPALIPGPSKLLEDAAREVTEQTKQGLTELTDKLFPDCEVDTVVLRHASPGEALAEHAAAIEADLIIVGSHGRTGLRRMLLGSVAERVVRLAKCPVLVVPPPVTE